MDRLLPQQAEAIAGTLSRVLRALGSAEDPGMDLPLAQLRLCNVLRDGPRPMNALSRELRTSQSAVSQTADRLERAGIIARVCEGDDRRVKHLCLTAHGAEMLRARREARIARIAEALERLTDEQRAQVCASLDTLAQACREE